MSRLLNFFTGKDEWEISNKPRSTDEYIKTLTEYESIQQNLQDVFIWALINHAKDRNFDSQLKIRYGKKINNGAIIHLFYNDNCVDLTLTLDGFPDNRQVQSVYEKYVVPAIKKLKDMEGKVIVKSNIDELRDKKLQQLRDYILGKVASSELPTPPYEMFFIKSPETRGTFLCMSNGNLRVQTEITTSHFLGRAIDSLYNVEYMGLRNKLIAKIKNVEDIKGMFIISPDKCPLDHIQYFVDCMHPKYEYSISIESPVAGKYDMIITKCGGPFAFAEIIPEKVKAIYELRINISDLYQDIILPLINELNEDSNGTKG